MDNKKQDILKKMNQLLYSAKNGDVEILNQNKHLIKDLSPPFIRKLLNTAIKHKNIKFVDDFFQQHINIKNQMFSNVDYIIEVSNEEGYKYLANYFFSKSIY